MRRPRAFVRRAPRSALTRLPASQAIFADPNFRFADPAALFITPDHYVYRMLASQGVALESLGVPGPDGVPLAPVQPREVWRTLAQNFHLFRGTPVRARLRVCGGVWVFW